MKECIVCRYKTNNMVKLKSGFKVPICNEYEDDSCLISSEAGK